MIIDYMSFGYGRKDETIQSRDEFYSEHSNVILTLAQKERLEQNVEIQGILILKGFIGIEVVLDEFYQTFIFKDNQTDELYLKPLDEINIKVFFKKLPYMLLIYDIRIT